MILTRGRALRRRYVSPFSAAWGQHCGDTKAGDAPEITARVATALVRSCGHHVSIMSPLSRQAEEGNS